jgi:hypothetical protein
MYCLISQLYMQCVAVCIRVDCDGSDTHALCRLDDATGDFTAIGY